MYEGLFRRVLFPGYEEVRGRQTRAHIAEYERSQWLGAAELERVRLGKLNALLGHCWTHVPFLQSYWGDHGLKRAPLRHTSELPSYPLIDKRTMAAHYDDMIATPWRGRTLTKVTGGSTGDPFRFEYTMDVYARRTAVMWRGYGWGGARLGTRTAYLWGTGLRKGGWGGFKDRLYHGAFNRRFFDAFSLSAANIDRRIDEIVAYRPKAVVGYVTPVAVVARRMIETGRILGGVRGVLTGAEALYEPERRVIEQAFGCPVFNTYGARETMLMASECEHHGLHVNADHLMLETVSEDGRAVAAGASGDIAITDFHNFGMPMVRYLNGDRATYAAVGACPCGRGLPRLASVDGRVLDLIETPDGRHVPGEFFVYAMLDWPDVTQWQVVQTARDCVQVRLVVPKPWDTSRRARLTDKIQGVAGRDLRVDIVEVERIPTTASGKRRLTISLANSAMAG